MKIYVAGAVKDLEAVRRLQAILRRDGHVIVYDWTVPAIQYERGRIPVEDEQKKFWAYQDEVGIRKADAIVVIPPGKIGTHIEVGMAIALNKWIIILGKRPDSVLYHHPMVDTASTETELLERLYTNWLGTHP